MQMLTRPLLADAQDLGVVGDTPTIITLEGLLWQHPGTAKVCVWSELRDQALCPMWL